MKIQIGLIPKSWNLTTLPSKITYVCPKRANTIRILDIFEKINFPLAVYKTFVMKDKKKARI